MTHFRPFSYGFRRAGEFAPRLLVGGGSLANRIANLVTSALYSAVDTNRSFVARSGTGANPSDGDLVGFVTDQSSGQNFVAISDAARPTLNIDDGVHSFLFDGSDDGFEASFDGGTGPADASIFIAIKSTADDAIILTGQTVTQWAGIWQDINSTTTHAGDSGSPTIGLNGVDFPGSPTRGDVHLALATGEWQIYEISNVDLSNWSELKFSQYTAAFFLDGNMAGLLVIPTASFTADQRADDIIPYMATLAGMTELDGKMLGLGGKHIFGAPSFYDSAIVSRVATGARAAVGDLIGSRRDKANPNKYGAADSDGNRAILGISDGIWFDQYDGVDDKLYYTFLGGTGPAACSVFAAIKSIDDIFIMFGDSNEHFLGAASEADATQVVTSGCGAAVTIHVNGNQIGGVGNTGRDEFAHAISNGGWNIVEFRDVELNTWEDIGWSGYWNVGWPMDGKGAGLLIVDTGAELTAKRDTVILPWFREKLGLTALDMAISGITKTAWYDVKGGTSSIETDGSGGQPGHGDLVGEMLDKSDVSRHEFDAPADTQRPILKNSNGIWRVKHDGVDDFLSMPFEGGAGPADCSVFINLKTDDARVILFSEDGDLSHYMPYWDNTLTGTGLAPNSGTPTFHIDDVELVSPNNSTLAAAIATNEWVTLEVRNVNLTEWATFTLSGYASVFRYAGEWNGLMIIPTANFDSDDRQNIILPWLKEQISSVNNDNLIANIRSELWFSTADTSNLFTTVNNSGANAATDGDLIGYAQDKSGSGTNGSSTTELARPELNVVDEVKSILFDEYTKFLTFTFAGGAGPDDCSIFLTMKTTDVQAVPLFKTGASSDFPLVFNHASGSANFAPPGSISGTYVNGELIGTTQGDARTAIATGQWVIVEIRGADLSGYAGLNINGYGGAALWEYDGEVGDMIIVKTGRELIEKRHQIEAYLREKAGM
ncbi:hypothetical protein [uncultured Paraglaciecola sp.]|uniref:hypothetical protein n=1 Tax=uncultured Paraglaciecola sp. TaxID=1765024 RepID=UPI0026067E57|nr:hypothetical protein [uncultured Paraglaciecola sp.]